MTHQSKFTVPLDMLMVATANEPDDVLNFVAAVAEPVCVSVVIVIVPDDKFTFCGPATDSVLIVYATAVKATNPPLEFAESVILL